VPLIDDFPSVFDVKLAPRKPPCGDDSIRLVDGPPRLNSINDK